MSGYRGHNRGAAKGGPQSVQRSYASQLKEHEPMFNTYEHLQGLSRGDTALTMLRKIASLVKPIMRKRGWRVQILAEFLPPESNLLGLNINRGYKICIRLRYHNNPDLFLPLEQVVDTMLHELSHIIWGEHDSNFHRLWDELRDEWETLIRKGYTGEGFLSEGKKLGGGGRMPPAHEMRRLARESAQKRQSQNKLTKGSGQRLGGTPVHLQGSDVRQIITDAITRRNTINKGCGSGRIDAIQISDDAGNNTFKTKAEEDDANNRAIMEALYDLMENEEERKLQGTFIEAPTDGGLAWHPEDGLYDPSTEGIPELNGSHAPAPSEEEQMKWAMHESVRSTPHMMREPNPLTSHPPSPIHRANTAAPDPIESKPSPVSAVSDTPMHHWNGSPISPLMPNGEMRPLMKRKRPTTMQSSLSDETIAEEDETIPAPRRNTMSTMSPIVDMDISDPFDPSAPPPEQWTCEICTCINPVQFLACDACGMERPQMIGIGNRGARPKLKSTTSAPAPMQDQSLGWKCTNCSAFMEHRWWTCSACGKMKDTS